MKKLPNSKEYSPFPGYNDQDILGTIFQLARESSMFMLTADEFDSPFTKKLDRLEALLVLLGYCAHHFGKVDSVAGGGLAMVYSKILADYLDEELKSAMQHKPETFEKFIEYRICTHRNTYDSIVEYGDVYKPINTTWILEESLDYYSYGVLSAEDEIERIEYLENTEKFDDCLSKMVFAELSIQPALDSITTRIGGKIKLFFVFQMKRITLGELQAALCF